MYQLWIETDKINHRYEMADLGDISPSMTYGPNDLAELANRHAAISMTIKLPKTPNNRRIFGYADVPDAQSDTPYQKHNCMLECNSHVLAAKGSYLIIKKITDEAFETQIKGGIASFFDTLKETHMGKTDLGLILSGNEGKFDNPEPSPNYIVPIASYQKKGERIPRKNYYSGLIYERPAIYLKNAVEKTIAYQGYKLNHNLSNNWEDLVLPVISHKITDPLNTDGSYDLYMEVTSFEKVGYYAYQNFYQLSFSNVDWRTENVTVKQDGAYKRKYYIYTAPFKHAGDVHISIESTDLTAGYIKCIQANITHFSSGGNEIKQVVMDEAHMYKNKKVSFSGLNVPLNFEKGDMLRFNIDVVLDFEKMNELETFPEIKSLMNIRAGIRQVRDIDEAPDNKYYPLADNIGFDTQYDFTKAVIQTFGAVVNVNERKKIVEMYNLRKIYDNKPYAIDWTDKMNAKGFETEYNIRDYAQENRISMQENKDDFITDSKSFCVENETLLPTKTLFTLPFESGKDYQLTQVKLENILGKGEYSNAENWDKEGNYKIANIPLFSETYDDQGRLQPPAFSNGKPHLLRKMPKMRIEFKTNNYLEKPIPEIEVPKVLSAGNEVTYTKEVIPVIHVTAEDIVNMSYTNTPMLEQAQMLTAEFLLTEEDIENYNGWNQSADCSGVFIPVYLRQTGAYYYINAIKNFRSGQLTKVELIRL